MCNQNHEDKQSAEDQADWKTGWFGCKYSKRKKTAIMTLLNYIVLPLAFFTDIVVHGIEFDHLCFFLTAYLLLNLPAIKGSNNDWMW